MADEFDDKNLDRELKAWRESANRQAERDDWFWARQRAQIVSRMQQPASRRVPTLAWAGIAATVAVGVALMVPGDKPPQVRPTIAVVATNNLPESSQVSDHELMQQLQATMNSNVPDALQPASVLQQELDQAYSGKFDSKVKESK